MAVQGTFGWELPDLSDIADGPDAFLQFADDVAATISDGTWQTYSPSWNTVPGQIYPGAPTTTTPSGIATRDGYYTLRNKTCDFMVELTFGSSVYGAYGALSVGLPVAASTLHTYQQFVQCSLSTPSTGTTWVGPAYIDAGATVCRPYFSISSARADMLPWASAAGVFTNKSNPDCNGDGRTCIQPGGRIVIQGRYHTA